VKLWRGVPAYLGWIGLFLFSSLADAWPAGAQQATGSAAESNSTTQSVAGQQRISAARCVASENSSAVELFGGETAKKEVAGEIEL
jgi:hypothetical protein